MKIADILRVAIVSLLVGLLLGKLVWDPKQPALEKQEMNVGVVHPYSDSLLELAYSQNKHYFIDHDSIGDCIVKSTITIYN